MAAPVSTAETLKVEKNKPSKTLSASAIFFMVIKKGVAPFLELNFDSLALRFFFNFKQRFLREFEESSQDVGREDLNLGVVLTDSSVVVFAGIGNVFFQRFSIVLEDP